MIRNFCHIIYEYIWLFLFQYLLHRIALYSSIILFSFDQLFCFYIVKIKIIISFTLYPAHSRVGWGNLVLGHSVPQFPPNPGILNKYLISSSVIEPTTSRFNSHIFVSLRQDCSWVEAFVEHKSEAFDCERDVCGLDSYLGKRSI